MSTMTGGDVAPVEARDGETQQHARQHVGTTAIVVALVVAGIALRWWVLGSAMVRPDSDEAVVGLMAEAFRHGHFDTYFWGQNYGGTLETGVAALLFAIFGASDVTLKVTSVVLTAVACVLVWRVGRRTVGEPAARYAAALFWAFPPAFVWISTKERGFYSAALVLVLTVLLFAIRVVAIGRTGARLPLGDLLALGFFAGLALWTTPQSVYVLAPIMCWGAFRVRDHWREVWPVVPAGVVGALPWLAWVAGHGRSAFYQTTIASTYPQRFKAFFTGMIPRAFGGRIPFSNDWLGGKAGEVAFAVVFVAAVAAVAWRMRDRTTRVAVEPLLVAALAYPFLATVPRLAGITDEPRYLLLLAPIVVLLLTTVLTSTAARALAAAAAIVFGFVFLGAMFRWLDHTPLDDEVAPASLTPVVHALDRLHVDRVYADYWIAYRLTFETDERIAASPVVTVRSDAIEAKVAASRTPPPYVVKAGDVYDRGLAAALERDGIAYRRIVAGRLAIILPARAVRPERYAVLWERSP